MSESACSACRPISVVNAVNHKQHTNICVTSSENSVDSDEMHSIAHGVLHKFAPNLLTYFHLALMLSLHDLVKFTSPVFGKR